MHRVDHEVAGPPDEGEPPMLRPNSRPRLRLVAAGLALCGGLAAAAPALAANAAPPAKSAAMASPSRSSTFLVGNTDAVDTLNPFLRFTRPDYQGYGLLYANPMGYWPLGYSGFPRLGY